MSYEVRDKSGLKRKYPKGVNCKLLDELVQDYDGVYFNLIDRELMVFLLCPPFKRNVWLRSRTGGE